jgi:membrane protein implicated in regulation of membrane protease activity
MTPSWLVLLAATALAVLSAVQAWLLWRLSRMVASSARLEDKVGRLADALSMLTETSEAGV